MQQRYHIFRCKQCDSYHYTGWRTCQNPNCGASLYSPVDIDSWPQLYIAPISSKKKSIVGLMTPSSSMIFVPTITTDGEVAFLQGGDRSLFESTRKNIRNTLKKCTYSMSSYACIFFSFVHQSKLNTLISLTTVTFFETLLFPNKIDEFDQWYRIFSNLRSTNDAYWNTLMSALSGDNAKSWINSMLLNIRTNNNWTEFIYFNQNKTGVDFRNCAVGEVFINDRVSVI